MDFDGNTEIDEPADSIEIYSKKAIWWFSFLASPLFGGVLLLINLKEAGYKKAIYPVLAFVLLFTILTEFLEARFMVQYKINLRVVNQPALLLSLMIIGTNVTGGLILTQYFFKKYFPENDYYPKSIINPLLATVVIMLLMRVFGA